MSSNPINYLACELTGRCQLRCVHCYADSSPRGDHGIMTDGDWLRVIDEAAALGIEKIQFIGGEPTTHPSLRKLVTHALSAGLRVELFTNLFHMTDDLWALVEKPRVSLATSYYSDLAGEHDSITRRSGSHARTRANIAEAVRREIPIRVGIVDRDPGQRVQAAKVDLTTLGVTRIKVDRERQIGRGASTMPPNISQLCGNCGQGVAVSSDGDLSPCVIARWLVIGNVRDAPLGDILDGPVMSETMTRLRQEFASRPPSMRSRRDESGGDKKDEKEDDGCPPGQ